MMESAPGRGVYIHVPFCKSRCDFCSFYLEVHQPKAAAAFVQSLIREITLYRELSPFGNQPLTSVYFGGGTPTTLSTRQLKAILAVIRETFVVDPRVEISIEAHPGTVTRIMLGELVEAGFNRVSFGAESMNGDELIRVGRPGSPKGTAVAVAAARQAGFTNINLDLMYGLPGQTTSSWLATLEYVLGLNPTHLACYALTIEDGTRLEDAIRCGDSPAPSAALQNDMEDLAEDRLATAGFARYEISNYHRADSRCRHNLLYWTGGFYLGLGPSAQSYLGDVRYGNISDLSRYTELLESGILPREEIEHLSPHRRMREAAVFGLRKAEGIPAELLCVDECPGRFRTVQRLFEEDYLERSGEAVRLTAHGRRYADEVAVRLL
jgi:oxygen-independent coproporphyrinogen-3 oxidase